MCTRKGNVDPVTAVVGCRKRLRAALGLTGDATIGVTELAYVEEGRSLVATVVTLLSSDASPLQHLGQKTTDTEDMIQAC